jgi:Zn-dependent protease with chaperone function
MPFLARFLFVSLATYSLLHLALGLMVSAIARPAVHLGERIRPRLAAGCLLALRLLPAAGAALIVAVVCVPSYLSNEPEAPTESVGYGCMLVALLGLGMWAVSIARGLRAAVSSRSFTQRCGQAGRLARLPGAPAPSYIVDSTAPLLALAGIVRPRLAISRGVLRVLTAEELAAALRHERAHRSAHDNLKRLFILLAPGILPLAASTRTLESGWRKFAEWAADDRAVGGSERRSCALAAALVRVARIAADSPQPSLASSLLGDTDQLAERVDRLLRAAPPGPRIAGRTTLALGAALLMASSLVVAILQPAALYAVHRVLERLEHFVE